MLQAYVSGAAQFFQSATVVFDHFHVIKLVGEAVDKVCRQEQREQDILRGTRYLWLKNAANLTKVRGQGVNPHARLPPRDVAVR